MGLKCPNCQAENPEEAAFCVQCGAKVAQLPPECPQCGTHLPVGARFCFACGQALGAPPSVAAPAPTASPPLTGPATSPAQPTSFAGGRYQVKKFLGEGGKKKVYLAHDEVLDRDIAFALIKTEKLDESARVRITREAQAMGRLGDHPHIVTVYDYGEHEGQPYLVLPLLPGGDIEGLLKKAPEHKLPLEQAVEIAVAVCRGLEFAHSRGIIHRDIKPGNVWLSADGTAKVGDFGLAVAVDLTRLTQSGMMVGTVSYMPPEQAMGGEITGKADLYSLGAMLYEMVTGRPPFLGDDSVAIIGQHINTPPVSPSWHREDLPPALETLILQLLEKDPGKRPDSAKVVKEALETVQTGAKAAEAAASSQTPAPAQNPLYRRVFVGREHELKHLQSAFDAALSGQGSLMMVVGEPGIGKTACCEQLSTYVTLRGGRTLLGHCYEEGSLSLPYLAFVEALRTHVMSRSEKDLKEELGTAAADVARIVSEIKDKLKLRPRPKQDPEEERYRLLHGVTSFLNHAASVQPLLLVLEDLHDADKGTLDMLTHLGRYLAGGRLLVVGTYRDVEVDRTHPLSAALAELRRLATYDRVLLRGLNPDEVHRMLEATTQRDIPWSLSEAVHRQTEGNPLFVQEVVRYLVEEGLLKERGGEWRSSEEIPLEMNIPEGLRDVIGKRLSLLGKDCNQLLSTASVIGREFSLETLRSVAAMEETTFLEALSEAVQLSVLEERSQLGQVRYRFTHAFFRQTLYEELIAPQRLRLHQQIARALETQYAGRLQEHASELAEHFFHSTAPEDLKKAVEYGEMAAKRAVDVYAYGEAARLFDQTIKVQQVLDPDDKEKLCDLRLDLCDVLLLALEFKRTIEIEAPAAFALAEGLGDGSRAARAGMAAYWPLIFAQMDFAAASTEAAAWLERIDRFAGPDSIGRAYVDAVLGVRDCYTGDVSSGLARLDRACDLAGRKGEQKALRMARTMTLWCTGAPKHLQRRYELAQGSRVAGSSFGALDLSATSTTVWTAETAMNVGSRRLVEEVAHESLEMIKRTGHIFATWLAKWIEAALSVMDGRLEEAIGAAEAAQELGYEMMEHPAFGLLSAGPGMRAKLHLGARDALEALARETQPDSWDMARPWLCLMYAHLGRSKEASELLETNVMQRPGMGTDEDWTPIPHDSLHLEAAVLVGHAEAAGSLLDRLDVPDLQTSGLGPCGCVPRLLGGAATLLGRYEEARAYYDDAIKICTEMPFRPELALSRLELAELLLEHYPDEKKEAREHLDFAVGEFREMKMQPALERALRHKEILKA